MKAATSVLQLKNRTDNWIIFRFLRRKKRAVIEYFDCGDFQYELDVPLGEGKRIYNLSLHNGYEEIK